LSSVAIDTETKSNELNREEIRFFVSDGTAVRIPVGGFIWWNSSVWNADFTHRESSKGRYIKGKAGTTPSQVTPGNTHAHEESGDGHEHSVAAHVHTSPASSVNTIGGFPQTTLEPFQDMSSVHSHPVVYANDLAGESPVSSKQNTITGGTSHEPAFVDLVGLERISTSAGEDIEVGTIAVWLGLLSNIPADWYLCDGTNQTPNALGRFVRCAATTGAIGAAGGAATHGHSSPQHKHTAGHRHTLTFSIAPNADITGSDNISGAQPNHIHPSTQSGLVKDNVLSENGQAVVDAANNEPEYVEVAFIRYDPTVLEVDPYGYVAGHV
jgi:hypothetical protein